MPGFRQMVFAAICSVCATAAVACEEIRFAPGATSGTVEALAPRSGSLCYSFETGIGQRAELIITESPVVTFFFPEGPFDGVYDRLIFTTTQTRYEFRVMAPRGTSEAYFTLRLTIL